MSEMGQAEWTKTVTVAQTLLSLPADGLCLLARLLRFLHQVLAPPSWKPVAPRRFDQQTPNATVSGSCDSSSLGFAAARVFRGNQAEVAHQLTRRFESADVAELGDHRHRRHRVDATKRHQRIHYRPQAPTLPPMPSEALGRSHLTRASACFTASTYSSRTICWTGKSILTSASHR